MKGMEVEIKVSTEFTAASVACIHNVLKYSY